MSDDESLPSKVARWSTDDWIKLGLGAFALGLLLFVSKFVFPNLPTPDIASVTFPQWAALGASVLFGIALGCLITERFFVRRQQKAVPATLVELKTATSGELRRVLDPTDPESLTAGLIRELRGKEAMAENLLGRLGQRIDEHSAIALSVSGTHGDFLQWSTQWRRTAREVLDQLKVGYFRQRGLMMEPSDYADFVNSVEVEHFHQGKNSHADTIRICGSMVGFAFLLPDAFTRHAHESGTGFKRLNVLAVDSPSGKDMFWYPVYLVAHTARGLWNCSHFRECIKAGHTFVVDIRYATHDLLAAVIDVPKASIAVLQSLDHESFSEILNTVGLDGRRRRYQLGFRFDNTPSEHDEYDRYAQALDGIWEAFRKRSELWVFHPFADSLFLKIWSPRWDASTVQARQSSEFADSAAAVDELLHDRQVPDFLANAKGQHVVNIHEQEMMSFFGKLIDGIPDRSPGIKSIENTFSSRHEEIGHLRGDPCSCK